jgi:hypothetical protein
MPDKPKGRAPGKPFIKNDTRINRNGRPKKGTALTDILNYNLDMVHKSGKLKREAIAEKLIEVALDGDLAALKYIMDRTDGKPIETIRANLKTDTTNMEKIIKKLEDAILK